MPVRRSHSLADPDAPLVARARSHELEAFAQLVDRHRGTVHRLVAGMAGEGDADDLTQEAFLRAFHRLDGFRGDASFRAWLLRIAHNAALDAATRRPAPEPLGEDDRADGPDGAPSPAPRSPAEELEARERAERLQSKLQLLAPAHRSVLVLRALEGLSYAEIARITDSPIGSVKGRLHRARHELIGILRANTYDWELPG